ncbi:S-layer homology domain-containing protein [uncultured Oscillibacter sp.]|uniref:S-layer homology domain-containing protein n=1 Tax=uncultured Oscillibacter sp. TaxID=876091 RepID=UPI0025FDACF2|nr:S-layer homology domain-containing protein [uncultured Oscillibacter sp.]
MKKLLSCLTALALTAVLAVPMAGAYSDIPAGGALSEEVWKAVDYGLMNGYAPNTFGYTDSMTRAQFVTVVGRMLGWFEGAQTAEAHITSAMQVPQDISVTYWNAISAAAKYDVVDTDRAFRPGEAVTRGEMAEILVRALGLKPAAAIAEKESDLPFSDVAQRKGYIAVAYAVGMTKGTSATTYAPDATATRAQAAAMLVRIYEKIHQAAGFVHGFYALSSYSQLDLAGQMDAVSAGWSRMTWDGTTALLSTTGANSNEYYVPTGYQEVTDYMSDHQVDFHLSVFMEAGGGLRELLASADGRSQAVEQIVNELTVTYQGIGQNPYSGVTIDFEGLRSAQRADFTAFLTELSAAVDKLDKSLYVCVSPALTGGAYYDGYDYRAIGDLADKVILMAYDYEARDAAIYLGTAVASSQGFAEATKNAPAGQVFWSLLAITDSRTGVRDPEKVLLGVSSKNVAWEVDGEGRLVSAKPVYLANDAAYQYIQQGTAGRNGAYAVFTAGDGKRYFLWLEDPLVNLRSAKLLGVTGVSLWRLGTLPMYDGWSWQSLLRTA